MSGRVVSDIQTRAEGESLYIRYNTAAHVVNSTYPTNDVTRCAESAIYILHIFAYNFGTRLDRIEQ